MNQEEESLKETIDQMRLCEDSVCVWWVECARHDGIWRSPMFSSEQLALEFSEVVPELWWVFDGDAKVCSAPVISTMEEAFDADVMKYLWYIHEYGDLQAFEDEILAKYMTWMPEPQYVQGMPVKEKNDGQNNVAQ